MVVAQGYSGRCACLPPEVVLAISTRSDKYAGKTDFGEGIDLDQHSVHAHSPPPGGRSSKRLRKCATPIKSAQKVILFLQVWCLCMLCDNVFSVNPREARMVIVTCQAGGE